MLTITRVIRPNKSIWIEANTRFMRYYFSTHSICRTMQRTTNIGSLSDLEKPVRRIIRCITTNEVERWVIKQGLGKKVILHDTDISMMYIVARKKDRYEVITTFNEFWKSYDNTQGTPELWVSLSNQNK